MNLIALRGFKNNAKNDIKLAGDPVHPDGVHKGARFTIGDDRGIKEIRDKRLMDIITNLNHAECIGDANDKDLCTRIDAEVALEKKQREEAAKLAAAGSTTEMAKQLVAAMQDSGWTPPSAKGKKGPLDPGA